MRILFPTLHLRPSGQATPLAAGCLAAALPQPFRKAVRQLDFFPPHDVERMREEICFMKPELVAFPLYLWNRLTIVALARQLRRELPAVILVAGGPEAAIHPEKLLAEGVFDGIVCGEGEKTFADLIEVLNRGGSPVGLPGTIWRTAHGPAAGPPAEPLDPHQLPSPWLTGVLAPPAGGCLLWEVSRGAGPDGGSFPAHLRRRDFPAVRLQEELELFVQSGVSCIRVIDSAFNSIPERGKEFLRLLLPRAAHIHFLLDARPEFLDPETVLLLSHMDCALRFDLHSFRPDTIQSRQRNLDPALLAHQIQLLRGENVPFHFGLVFGLPEDDFPGFRGKLSTVLDFAPAGLEVSPLTVAPGSSLYRQRDRLELQTQEDPPYEVLESPTFGPTDLASCRRLAAAVDLLYNLGSGSGLWPALRQATGLAAVSLLDDFSSWAAGQVPNDQFLCPESWPPEEIFRLQENFIENLLNRYGKSYLVPAALDLVRFYHHQAQTLAGDELNPPATAVLNMEFWNTPLKINPAVRLVSFTYEILDLLEMGDIPLDQFVVMFRPVGSTVLFSRRGRQLFCESVDENLLRLLQESDGSRSPRAIFAGSISPLEGNEIVDFAVAEGLLTANG